MINTYRCTTGQPRTAGRDSIPSSLPIELKNASGDQKWWAGWNPALRLGRFYGTKRIQDNTYHRIGFTLTEMAIVLIIIGLITAGVTGSKRLIKNAQIRAVVTDFTLYNTAVSTFVAQYGKLPGDFARATYYWANTENGDGDGRIDTSGTNGCNGSARTGIEIFRAWQHLQSARILQGSLTGLGASTGDTDGTVTGENVPGGKYPSSAYTLRYIAQDDIMTGQTITIQKNVINAGKVNTTCARTDTPIYKVEDAEAIDTKIDNGIPSDGLIISSQGNTTQNCVSGSSGNYQYNITSGALCEIFYSIAY